MKEKERSAGTEIEGKEAGVGYIIVEAELALVDTHYCNSSTVVHKFQIK
jgi:hypothetical protein